MFITAVRVERDLGVPSVSFNTPTGHRSCTPEDCSELVANSPQGPVPVSGVFPAGSTLHLLETRLQAVWLSPCRADPPARHPIRLGMDCRFPGMLLSPTTLSGPGQPSDPETTPLVSARCAGDTPVHLMAHRLLRRLRHVPTPPAEHGPAHPRPGRPGDGLSPGRFPRSLRTGRQVRCPTLPLRHRHEYAADLPRGLPTGVFNQLRSRPPSVGVHRNPAHIHQI
jgi:hypothetical protein